MIKGILLLALSLGVQAQTVTFTAGSAVNNYLPVLTENGAAINSNWYTDYVYDCALTTNVCEGYEVPPGESVQIVLPVSPTHPGDELGLNCTGVVTTPPLPPGGQKIKPPTTLVSSDLTCVDFAFSADSWTGTVTYVYQYVPRRERFGTAYYPVAVSGYGEVTH
jgi:hypothetical protein